MFKAVTNGGGGSSQPDPEPATTPGYQDPSKIAEIVKDGLSLGENSKPDIPESKPEPDTKAPPIIFDVTMNEIMMEKVKDSSGNPKEDNSPPKAKKLSGTKQGVGVQVKPV
ncbi:hypothetical protein U1Q18_049674 [Sarracenia purpurea var. burkii]